MVPQNLGRQNGSNTIGNQHRDHESSYRSEARGQIWRNRTLRKEGIVRIVDRRVLVLT